MVRSTPWRLVWRDFDAIAYDPNKSDAILAVRGFDLEYVSRIFPGYVLERQDTRRYSERRFQAIGELLGTIYVVVYTRIGQSCRLITAWEAEYEDRVTWHELR
jgi:uncharacterized DUF497 family protein